MTDTVDLIIGGQSYQDWLNVSVSRGIERLPSTFQVTCSKTPGTVFPIKKGMTCKVKINGTPLVNGYVMDVTFSYAQGATSVTIAGMSKAGKIMSCDIDVASNMVSGSSAIEVAETLVAELGLTVVNTSRADFPPIGNLAVNAGETYFAVLDRICTYSGVLLMDSTLGHLLICDVGTVKQSDTLKEGVNVLTSNATYSIGDRHTSVKVLWQSQNNIVTALDANGNVVPDSNVHGMARDPHYQELPGYWPKVVISSTTNGSVDLGQRTAQYLANRAWGRSQAITVTVPTWIDSSGNHWSPNWLVDVDLPECEAQGTFLITDVTYIRGASGQGTSTQLVLMPPEAFSIRPINIYPNQQRDAIALLQGGGNGS